MGLPAEKGLVWWYHSHREIQKQLPVEGLGIQEVISHGIVERPAGVNGYLFILFNSTVHIETDRGIQPYPPKTLFIWPPNQKNYYGSKMEKWNHSWFLCVGNYIGTMLQENAIQQLHPYHLAYPERFEWYVEAMHRELITNNHPDHIILANFIVSAIREVARMINLHQDNRYIPENFIQIKIYIEQNYNLPLTLNDLAQKAGISASHLSRLFKKYYEVSPIDHLIRIRMRHANRLLGDHNLSIKEIALRLGYNDIYQFSRAFKKYYGMSPKSMRLMS